jgi:hypothetical protein
MLPDLFRLPPGALASLRPAAIADAQRQHAAAQAAAAASTASQQPQLLQQLQACLQRAMARSAGAGAAHGPADALSRQREVHAHHQVFGLLAASMTTYRPLLMQIKVAYDAALAEAVAASCDNAFLRARLADARAQHAQRLAAARDAAEQAAAAMEVELAERLQLLQAQAQQVRWLAFALWVSWWPCWRDPGATRHSSPTCASTQQVSAECAQLQEQLGRLQKATAAAHGELAAVERGARRASHDLLAASNWGGMLSALSSGGGDDVGAETAQE